MSMPQDLDCFPDAVHLRLYSPDLQEISPDLQGEEASPELRLWSEGASLALLTDDDEADTDPEVPIIFKIDRAFSALQPRTQQQLVARTKLVYRNRHCRKCHSPSVVTIQRNDAVLNRNGMPIPGTATLVGFKCRRCSAEWKA